MRSPHTCSATLPTLPAISLYRPNHTFLLVYSRVDDGRYGKFQSEISAFIPSERLISDPVRTFAYGTDASFYRLNPKLVVKIHNEAEVRLFSNIFLPR